MDEIAGAGAGTLPHDVIIEILSRLPVRSLCQFRCVSKQWLSLLSPQNKSFLRKHRQASKKNPLFIFRKYSSVSDDEDDGKHQAKIELTGIDTAGSLITKVVSSIDGPVYTFVSCGPLVVLSWAYRVCVCNPSTGEFARLPRSSSVSQYDVIGLGYIPDKNQYKIVHLFAPEKLTDDDDKMGCEIFILGDGEDASSGSWRRIDDCSHIVRTNCSTICLNGVLYWKVSDQAESGSVLAFDLETEEFHSIPHPKSCSGGADRNPAAFITGFKGNLCLLTRSRAQSPVSIWLLDRKDWVKLSVLDTNLEIRNVFSWDDQEGELLVSTRSGGLVFYSVQKKSYRAVKNTATVECYKKPCIYYDGFFSLGVYQRGRGHVIRTQ